MKLKIFTIARPEYGEEAFDNWHRQNPGIKINSKHICAHGKPERLEGHDEFISFDRLYVFYDTPGDAQYSRDRSLLEQNSQYEMCEDVARAMLTDQNYRKLTNKQQRQLYLLDTRQLPKEDAEVVDTILQMHKAGIKRL